MNLANNAIAALPARLRAAWGRALGDPRAAGAADAPDVNLDFNPITRGDGAASAMSPPAKRARAAAAT